MTAGGVDGKTPLGQEGLDPTLQLYNRRMAQRRHVFAQSAIRRERLSHEAHQGAKALVYCAPSGFGKSTQLAIMAEDAGSGNAAYLSLAEFETAEGSDGSCVERVMQAILDQLSGPDAPQTKGVHEGEAVLFARLWKTEQPILLCFDEFIPAFADLAERIICETPSSVKLAFAPIGVEFLSRLALLPGVVRVRSESLAFNEAEIDELALLSGAPWSTERALELTGGWPALLRFAVDRAEPLSSPIQWPEVQNFLHNDVFAKLTVEEREVLRNASILQTVTPESYRYVFKANSDLEHWLKRLSAVHGVLVAGLANDGEKLVMLPVLRDFLREELRVLMPDRISYLLKRIAYWHWRQGEYRETITAALDAHDHRWAHRVSAGVLIDIALRQGEIAGLREWFASVPRDQLNRLPALAFGYAWTMYFSQQAQVADEVLEGMAATEYAGQNLYGQPRGWPELVFAIGKATHDELDESTRLCHQWIDSFGEDNEVGAGAAYTCLAFIAASERQFEDLSKLSRKAFSINRYARQRYASGWLSATNVLAAMRSGEMLRARTLVKQSRESSDIAVERSPFASNLLQAFEYQLCEEIKEGVMPEGLEHDAINFAMEYGVVDVLAGVTQAAARRMALKGLTTEAFALMEKVRATAHRRQLPRLRYLAEINLAEFHLLEDGADADVNLPKPNAAILSANQLQALDARLARVRALIEIGKSRFGLAEQHARLALREAGVMGDLRAAAAAQYCLATALVFLGSTRDAERAFREAEELVALNGCHTTREWMMALLLRIVPETIQFFDTIGRKGEALHSMEPSVGSSDKGLVPVLAGRLTRKQYLVLQYIARGMTNKEIAAQLSISESGAKWHVKRLFERFGVSKRSQLVATAQAKNLL